MTGTDIATLGLPVGLVAETAMLAYDAQADEWTVADHPINARMVVIGGLVRRAGDPVGGFEFENSTLTTDDVWAYDPETNSWTPLLPASDHPASLGQG